MILLLPKLLDQAKMLECEFLTFYQHWRGVDVETICFADVQPGEERVRVKTEYDTSFSVHVTLNRDCQKLNPVAVEADVQNLISENSDEDDADGSHR